MQAAALAAHRFGYSETSLRAVQQADPRAWVQAQIEHPAPFDMAGLADGREALRITHELLRANLSETPQEQREAARRALRELNRAGLQRRWQHIVATDSPVAERWVQFWANHCCVAATKGSTLGLIWPHENEAIRPHAFGRFQDLLRASTLHPAMLLYLDNAQSVGPDSRAGRRPERPRGLNENLARELLELHTLGANDQFQGGYTQADVTETARLLTGWTVRFYGDGTVGFQPALHQPGPKTILGKRYAEGPQALDALLADLSRHPATARHLALKLARHFVTDDPPPALVDAVARRFLASDGDLRATAQALFAHDLAWSPDHAPKFKRPEELLLSAHRMLKLPLGGPALEAGVQALQALGQPPGRAPSPQGWPDRGEDWLSPDALYKRVLWAERFAARHASAADARALSRLAYGEDLGEATRLQIERADSGAQALALWLASPEFQRR